MVKILVIEDEEPISELIRINLELAGYEVIQAADGEEGLSLVKTSQVDLVLLDIMLPKIDGYSILPQILKRNIPIIILTAKDSLKDRVIGLNMGADDYITKPFEGMELIARIKVVLRRVNKDQKPTGFDNVQICTDRRKVFKSGKEVELTPKEFDLLKVLIDNKGIALSRERLLELVWQYDYEGNTRTVDMHVQRIRNKLETEKIRTVYKIGYRLED